MSSADDFMNKLDVYIATCLREHKPGLHAVDVKTGDSTTRGDLVHALERLVRDTAREAVEYERKQNPGHH
jgi:hypothetical protein